VVDFGRSLHCLTARREVLIASDAARGLPQLSLVACRFSHLLTTRMRLQLRGAPSGRYALVNANTGALTELFSTGKAAAPCVLPLPTGELLLTKDSHGIFIGAPSSPGHGWTGSCPSTDRQAGMDRHEYTGSSPNMDSRLKPEPG
jgi:hypothetical protein